MPLKFPQYARTLLRLMACGVVSMVLSGCQGLSNTAQLRVIDATPDAGAMDVYSADGAIAYNVGFGTTTSYIPVAAATHVLNMESAGTRTVLSSTKAALLGAKQYTMVVSNIAGAMQTTVLADQSTPAAAGQSAVRFLNEATSAGAYDLYLLRKGDRLGDALPVAKKAEFGTNTGYVNVPAGVYAVVALPAGTQLKNSAVATFIGASTAYSSGSVRTVVLVDVVSASGHGLRALVANDYEPVSVTE